LRTFGIELPEVERTAGRLMPPGLPQRFQTRGSPDEMQIERDIACDRPGNGGWLVQNIGAHCIIERL
jgi:hypothetical protein